MPLKPYPWLIAAVAALAVAPVAAGQAVSSTVIAASAPVRPVAMVADGDGNAIAVGSISATREGWASKVQSDGRVVWSYIRVLAPAEQAAIGRRTSHPVFYGAVAMRDGSTFLCGSLPRAFAPGAPAGALLAHLDQGGKSTGETFVDFGSDPAGRTLPYTFVGCLQQDQGVFAAAYEEHLERATASGDTRMKASYGIAKLHPDGTLAWRRTIAGGLGEGHGIDPEGFGFDSLGYGYVFLVTTNIDTELILLNADGTVRAKKVLPGRFSLVKRTAPGPLTLIGGSARAATSIVTFDGKLNETGRRNSAVPLNFVAIRAFLAERGDFALFGTPVSGSGLSTHVMLVDAGVAVRDGGGREGAGETIRAAVALDGDHFMFATPSAGAATKGARIGRITLGR
jgi:hypothetical protein